jgi:hypothetical protein
MELQLLPVPYHGAASYGTICVWRFDQETWVSLDTAAQMVITRNSYMIAKSSEIVDALPTFQQLLQAIRPYPQMRCSFAPMSLSHLQHLALNTPFFDGAGSSTPTFTYTMELLVGGRLLEALNVCHHALPRMYRHQTYLVDYNEVASDATSPMVAELLCPFRHVQQASWNPATSPLISSIPEPEPRPYLNVDRFVHVQVFSEIRHYRPNPAQRSTVVADGVFTGKSLHPRQKIAHMRHIHDQRKWPSNFTAREVLEGVALMPKVDSHSLEGRFYRIFNQTPPANLRDKLNAIEAIRTQAEAQYGEEGLERYLNSQRKWKFLVAHIR